MVIQKQNMESKKYVFVMNHVREIVDKDNECSNDDNNVINVKKNKKSIKKHEHKIQSSSTDDNNERVTDISKTDLKELKHVYNKCKAVLIKIESKYGHLLNLDSENELNRNRKRKHDTYDECSCTLNKKIVFDVEGREVYDEQLSQNHICVKKLKNPIRHKYNLQIEHEDSRDNLPDSIEELTILLKDPTIKSNIRRRIIHKRRDLREEYLNMIRFEKSRLIERLKTNAEEMFGFKGTNLSSLAGYPTVLQAEEKH